MSLAIGTRLGVYEVREPIGAGGMGEVCRATDTKLGRDVALKVLPEALRRDEERLLRFEREARVLASLNHPGIATLHGLERSEDITFLVMELVPGETLQERLMRGPLLIEEAMDLFVQIAEALEAAHAAGVVHRDLKPANVKITPAGRIKILDFGLAKAFAAEEPSTDLSHSPTLTRDATRAGVILGTAPYMSPEQAKGRKADKRADIWAFGCVLFEALSGKRVFEGESVADVLANVIHKDPPWEALPAETPWRVRDVLRRCLAKNADLRFHDIADARLELEDDSAPAPSPSLLPTPRSRVPPWLVGALGALSGLVLGLGVTFFRETEAPPSPVQRFAIAPPSSEGPLRLVNPTISRDGRRIVYVGVLGDRRRLYLRELDQLESRAIEGTDGAHSPFFSPDGLWIGFLADGKMKKVSVLGGAPIDLCNAYAEGPGGAWTLDDTIWFSGNWNSGFLEVSSEGGEPVAVTSPDRERREVGHWWPDFLPDGTHALFTVFMDDGSHRIAVIDLGTGRWTHLFPGMQGRYEPSGHVVFFRSGIYQSVPFDSSRSEVQGGAVPVLDGTRGISPLGSVETFFDVSEAGLVVSVPGGAEYPRAVLTWLSLDGDVEPLPFGAAAIGNFDLDPSGHRAAVTRNDGGVESLWIYDFTSGTEEKITRESNDFRAHWMPDGARIVFTSSRRGQYDIFVKPADALGEEELLVGRDVDESAEALSPDGRWLALAEYLVETGEDIAVLDLKAVPVNLANPQGVEPVLTVRTAVTDSDASFSRDSAWLAFRSLASGRSEIYVERLPDGAGRVRVSTNGGDEPAWSPTRDELYYVSGDTVMAVAYRVVGGEFRPDAPRILVKLPERASVDGTFELSPDGERFLLLVETGEDPSPTELHVTANWTRTLGR
ncbi:MAG TPA: protein kinase [Vicinamibacteria bacterium]|nr:protein kinase [Vicinamibacteria bacterium]